MEISLVMHELTQLPLINIFYQTHNKVLKTIQFLPYDTYA